MSERRPPRRSPAGPGRRLARARQGISPQAWLWIGAGGLLALVAVLVAIAAYNWIYVPPRETVLQVGDRKIKMADFVDYTRYYIGNSATKLRRVAPLAALPAALSDLERDEILRQAGPSQGLTATDDEVEKALRLKAAVFAGKARAPELLPPKTPTATPAAATDGTPAPGGAASPEATPSATATPDPFAGDDAGYKKALGDVLRTTHLSERELRNIVRAEVLLEKLRDRFRSDIPAAPPQVQALVIIVPTQQLAARAKARLDAGEDFDLVQEEVSPQTLPQPLRTPSPSATPTPTPEPASSPAPRTEGPTPVPIATPGPIPKTPREAPPWATRETLVAAFAEPAFKTPAGKHSEIIPTDRGFAILKIVAREESRPLDENQREFYVQRAVEKWVKEQSEQITVKRHLDADKTEWALDRLTG